MAPPWAIILTCFSSALLVVKDSRRCARRSSALGLVWGGQRSQYRRHRRGRHTGTHGAAIVSLFLGGPLPCTHLRHRIFGGRPRLELTVSKYKRSTVDPRTRSTAPCHRVHRTRGTPRHSHTAMWLTSQHPQSTRSQSRAYFA